MCQDIKHLLHKYEELGLDPYQQHETLLPHLTSFIAGIEAKQGCILAHSYILLCGQVIPTKI